MQKNNSMLITLVSALALIMSACNTQPTPDAAAISTSAAQTVEARFTELAVNFTATPLPATETPLPKATATSKAKPSATTAPAGSGKACYAMTFLSDVTIPDGMIIAPGATFTKTWRVRNDGNCVWDQKYALELEKGAALGTVTKTPLTRVVNPGDSLDLSIEFTAPTTEGDYTGYWHVATPFGGYMGVGMYNQSLSVMITVSSKPALAFGAVSVVYDWNRRPQKGCTKDGAVYNFTATITANGPGNLNYRWDHNPFDGSVVGDTLKFTAAGSKTVTWSWVMTPDHKQGIDRWVAITTIVEGQETTFNKILFMYSCDN
ncbi:MAG: NBR1-Ig-like domain-containing protein [Chloroflexota bacterium]